MQADTLIRQSEPFIRWMVDWHANLKPLSLDSLVTDADPSTVGIICVDIIEGFCSVGPLASPRVNRLVKPIHDLIERAWASGVRSIALTQDAHPTDAVEFAQYGRHCVRDTVESQTAAAIRALPFFDSLTIIPKNSINSGLAPGFVEWVQAQPHVRAWLILGDCTDLCTYQLAMHMRLSANQQQQMGRHIIVPASMVDTYDMPVARAAEQGVVPHDAEFLHLTFLYSMMLNGVEVVRDIV